MKTYFDCASLTRGIFYCALITFLGVSSLAAIPPKDPSIPPKDPRILKCDQQHPKCYGNRIDENRRVLLRHHITEECRHKHGLRHELEYSCWTECHAWWPLKHSPLGPPETVQRDVFLVYATSDQEKKTFSAMHFDPELCKMAAEENMTRIGCALRVYAVHEPNDKGGHLHMGTTILCSIDNPIDVHEYVV